MQVKKIAALLPASIVLSAAMLFSACRPVEERPPELIYYAETMERFFFPEDSTEAEAETDTVTETETEAPPETETETETEIETEIITSTVTEVPEEYSETGTEEPDVISAEVYQEIYPTTEAVSETAAETYTEVYTETETVPAETEPPQLYQASFTADSSYVKPLGRTFMKDGVRILSHTCSGVEFAFRGNYADITLTSNCKTSKARAAIYVNGKMVKDTMLNNSEETFHIFDSDEAENCIVSVVKLSEAAYSNIGVKSINVNSEFGIIPTPERTRKIEFIGDSITCGYGVDAADQYEAFATTNENGEKTYAAITGKYFNAEYNVVSWSGIGVYSSYTEGSKPNQSFLMPSVYEKTAANERTEKWNFSQWQPDLIVINLGTNDNTWTKGIQERVDLFGSAYYDFIKQVRAVNPDAYIICSLGVMGSKLLPEIKEQVEAYSRDTGDNRITTFEFDYRDGKADGFGAGFHPSAKTHQKMADKLIPFISEIMGW